MEFWQKPYCRSCGAHVDALPNDILSKMVRCERCVKRLREKKYPQIQLFAAFAEKSGVADAEGLFWATYTAWKEIVDRRKAERRAPADS
jgi:hypothetical protein